MSTKEFHIPIAAFASIDRRSPLPLYYQVATMIENEILEGRVPPGARFENEIALAARLGVSRPTVRRALQEAVDRGLMLRRRGVGTQVVHGLIRRKVELTSLNEDLKASGQAPTTKVLAFKYDQADARLAKTLGIELGEPVAMIRRLRYADGIPVALLENWLPLELLYVGKGDLDDRGLYELMRSKGINIAVANQRITARKGSASECELLGIDKGAAVLTMERTAYNEQGRAVEWGRHCYRPDLYSFEITLVDK